MRPHPYKEEREKKPSNSHIERRWPAVCGSLRANGFDVDLVALGPTALSDDALWARASLHALTSLPLSKSVSASCAPRELAAAVGAPAAALDPSVSAGISAAERAQCLIALVSALDPHAVGAQGRANAGRGQSGSDPDDVDPSAAASWLDAVAADADVCFASTYRLPTSRVIGKKDASSLAPPPAPLALADEIRIERDTVASLQGAAREAARGIPREVVSSLPDYYRTGAPRGESGAAGPDQNARTTIWAQDADLERASRALEMLRDAVGTFNSAYDIDAAAWVERSSPPALYGVGSAASRLVPVSRELERMRTAMESLREAVASGTAARASGTLASVRDGDIAGLEDAADTLARAADGIARGE